jgi:guanine deaminase
MTRPTEVTQAFRGPLLTPSADGSVRWFSDGALLLAGSRILYAGSHRHAKPRFRGTIRDVRPWIIAPGFVDTHTHFPQTRIIGQATGPLLAWLEGSVFPEEARFKRTAYAKSVADTFIDRMLEAGTTCAAIYSSSHIRATDVLFEKLAERGMRAVAGLTLMNQRCPGAVRVTRQAAMRGCERLAKRWHGHDKGRLRLAITPRFALSCSRGLLEDAGKLAAEAGLIVQTHIAETRHEGSQTLAAHSYANDYLDVYERAGLIHERTILAHAIHLSAGEWRRIAEADAAVSHCPDSNFFLGSGHMKLNRALGRGIRVALGSDVAAGRSFSMRRAMASAYDNSLCVKSAAELERLYRLATIDGARVLHCEAQTGSLEAGKDADFILLDVGTPGGSLAEVLSQVLFDNDQLGVRACFVRGRRLALRSPRG